MRILKIVLMSVFVLVLVAIIGAYIFLKTFHIEQYKPQIIAQGSSMLGRRVGLGDISLNISLKDGVGLNLKNISIGDDPAFATGDFFQAENIYLHLDLLALWKTHTISFSSLQVKAPRITIIKNQAGLMAVTHLNLTARIKDVRVSAGRLQDLLADVQIVDGDISLKDMASGISFTMRQMSLQVPDFSLNTPFTVKCQGAYASDSPNIFLQTGAQIDCPKQAVTLKNLTLTTDLGSFSVPQLQSSIAAFKDVILPENIKGKVQLTMAKLEASAKGVGPISGEVTLTAALGKGKVFGVGKLTDYLHTQTYNGQLSVDGVDLTQVLLQQKQPVQLEGVLSGKATFEGVGLSMEAIHNSLTANSHFAIANGRLKDINILQLVISKLEEIPIIGEKLQTGLPTSYQQALQEKDTIFQKVDLTADVKNGQLVIQPFEMAADGFIFMGQGTIGFDQQLDLKGSFIMASDLSQAMVQAVHNLQYLYNAQQQIEFPMVVTGTFASPRPLPDFNYITKRAIINEGKRQLEKLINKYLPVGITSGQGTDQSTTSSDQQQQNENPTGKAIDTILSNFFK